MLVLLVLLFLLVPIFDARVVVALTATGVAMLESSYMAVAPKPFLHDQVQKWLEKYNGNFRK